MLVGESELLQRQENPDADNYISKTKNVEKLYMEQARKILVQIPHRPGGEFALELTKCLYAWSAYGIGYQPILDIFGGWIEATRNMMVHLFLKTHFKYLLMCDDNLWPLDPTAPLRMAARDLPVVSGCACGIKPGVGLFLCVVVKDENGVARFPSESETDMLPSDGCSEIFNAGAGFMMIRRDVLETLWSRAYTEEQMDVAFLAGEFAKLQRGERADIDGCQKIVERMKHFNDDSGLPFTMPKSVLTEAAKTYNMPRGEDICFTDRVRKAGFKMYVDWSVHLAHEKVLPLVWDQKKRSASLDAATWKVSKEAIPAEI